MRIGLYHGAGLSGSDDGEHAAALARALAGRGHQLHVLCREARPERIEAIDQAWRWTADGDCEELFARAPATPGPCLLHRIPEGLGEAGAIAEIVERRSLDILLVLHTGHEIALAAKACRASGTPFVVCPGSAWVERRAVDRTDTAEVAAALRAAAGALATTTAALDGLLDAFPDAADELRARSTICPAGLDTAHLQPIPRSERPRALLRAAAEAPASGKSPALTAELRARLAQSEWYAVSDYQRAYRRELADTDLADKLARVAPADRVLLCHGPLTAHKGLQSLIAALPALLRAAPNTLLLIAGGGAYREVLEAFVHAIATRDEGLLAALIECGFDLEHDKGFGRWRDVRAYFDTDAGRELLLGQDESFARAIVFLGHLEPGPLRHLLPCADLAVFPAVGNETSPRALLEAAACGVLPVATDLPVFADALLEIETSLGESWTNRLRISRAAARVSGMARILGKLLGDPELALLAPELHRIVAERCDWGARAVAVERALRALRAPARA
jgi:glycosyltransferase involved in cell wall biosynthesis